jgi:hypothetical protein
MHEKLALLRSLATRPSSRIAPSLQPLLNQLCEAGYVANDGAGWMATAEGCAFIEGNRATPAISDRKLD